MKWEIQIRKMQVFECQWFLGLFCCINFRKRLIFYYFGNRRKKCSCILYQRVRHFSLPISYTTQNLWSTCKEQSLQKNLMAQKMSCLVYASNYLVLLYCPHRLWNDIIPLTVDCYCKLVTSTAEGCLHADLRKQCVIYVSGPGRPASGYKPLLSCCYPATTYMSPRHAIPT